MRILITVFVSFLVSTQAVAGRTLLSFAPIFGDNAILQCELDVNVWGIAEKGEEVRVMLDGRVIAATKADHDGNWLVIIPPHEAGGPHQVTAVSGDERITLQNVFFGEVWLASGQSNMVIPLSGSHGGSDKLMESIEDIHFVVVPQRTGLPVTAGLTGQDLMWNVFGPPQNQQIAAVAYYFSEYLLHGLGRKVGIIQSAYGGTPAQAWVPFGPLEKNNALTHYAEEIKSGLASKRTAAEWKAEVDDFDRYRVAMKRWSSHGQGVRPTNPGKVSSQNPYSSKTATVLYENMVKPLIPYTTRGVIWYQGESNVSNPSEYRELFTTLIDAWRVGWQRADWPFLFVQLAAFDQPMGDWPNLRDVQAFVRDHVPHTGMAVALDVGEKDDIHPKAKQPVGERLARLALSQVYFLPVPARGPHIKSVMVSGDSVKLSFGFVERGLQTGDRSVYVSGFEVCYADGESESLMGRIAAPDEVVLLPTKTENVVAVRYGWANWVAPPVNLQNSAGLPTEPFNYELVKSISKNRKDVEP